MRGVLVLFALLAASASAAAGWRMLPEPAARGESNPMIPLLFAVHLPNMERLAGVVMDRGDPASPNFRKWLTEAEMLEYASAPETTGEVMQTLRNQGAVDVEPIYRGAYVRAIMPRHTVEAAFETRLDLYVHDETQRMLWRAPEHSVPAALRGKVTHVLGLADFPSELRRLACPGQSCPATVRTAYTISPDVPAYAGSVVIFNDVSSGEAYNAGDRSSFLSTYAPGVQVGVQVIGPNTGASSCGGTNYNCAEAALDVQVASALLGNGTVHMFMSTNTVGFDSLFDFFAVLQELVANGTLPVGTVASISYGGDERENSVNYILSMYYESIKASAMGITLVAASGDQGVQGFLSACTEFSPVMPASTPFVLAVGATMGIELGTSEMVCTVANGARITSGGGFSGIIGRGSYQDLRISAYLSNTAGLPSPSLYRAEGRAYPDVAAAGRSFPIVVGGATVYVDGTSASAPVVAAMLARINAEITAFNRTVIGWPHPFLYRLPDSCFHDVVVGDNRCGDTTQSCCASGFPAAPGWDPVTGLGSLNYPCVLSYAKTSSFTSPPSVPPTPTNSAAAHLEWALAA